MIWLFALILSTGIMLLKWLTVEASKAIEHTEKAKYSMCSTEASLTQRLQHYGFQCYKLLCLLLECLKKINQWTILNLPPNSCTLMIQLLISISTK